MAQLPDHQRLPRHHHHEEKQTMGRELYDHRSGNELNNSIRIEAQDDSAGVGGAPTRYDILIKDHQWEKFLQLRFQGKPVFTLNDKGEVLNRQVDGISMEALIAVCLDRLRKFQSSTFGCRENALTITKLEEALHWLGHRSAERVRRGVEGTTKP